MGQRKQAAANKLPAKPGSPLSSARGATASTSGRPAVPDGRETPSAAWQGDTPRTPQPTPPAGHTDRPRQAPAASPASAPESTPSPTGASELYDQGRLQANREAAQECARKANELLQV